MTIDSALFNDFMTNLNGDLKELNSDILKSKVLFS